MSSTRDTGYLLDAPLGPIEDSQYDQSVHSHLCFLHLHSSHLSLPLTYSSGFSGFLSTSSCPPIPALVSLYQPSTDCFITMSFCEQGREKVETSDILCASFPLSPFPLLFPVFVLFLYALLPLTDLSGCY